MDLRKGFPGKGRTEKASQTCPRAAERGRRKGTRKWDTRPGLETILGRVFSESGPLDESPGRAVSPRTRSARRIFGTDPRNRCSRCESQNAKCVVGSCSPGLSASWFPAIDVRTVVSKCGSQGIIRNGHSPWIPALHSRNVPARKISVMDLRNGSP